MQGTDTDLMSLRETAERHGISHGYLSRRVKQGKEAKGYDLTEYVVMDGDGHIEGFDFPSRYDFPNGSPNGRQRSPETLATRAAQADPADVEDLLDEALAEGDHHVLPSREDWITEDQVVDLLAKHLPIDEEFGEVDYALQVMERGGYYRKDQIERLIRLAAHYGMRKAVRRVLSAHAAGLALERGEEDACEHSWLTHAETYDMLDRCLEWDEASKAQIEACMYTLLRPIEVGPPILAYFRQDSVNEFIILIGHYGFEEAIYKLWDEVSAE
jgi:hypothetical protein